METLSTFSEWLMLIFAFVIVLGIILILAVVAEKLERFLEAYYGVQRKAKKEKKSEKREVYIEIFTSPGCAYCPAVKKALEEISHELEDEITIEEVDITVDPTRATQYGIMSVPAVAINGILKFIGLVRKEELKKAIIEALQI